MRNFINEVSSSFIDEALASPRMLEDLASMEKYMSESYEGRTFVELIQNADDAGANRVKVDYFGNTLIVANDGRSFDENDIWAISRSGASNKQRGKNIGYRGVGFKSATTISTEIVIYSSNAYFTFSKSLCADVLQMPEDKVPTVRIPFVYDETNLDAVIESKVEELEADGFTTFFIFLNARIDKFSEELSGFDSGWLLFLRKICNVEINLPAKNLVCKVRRKQIGEDTLIKIVGNKEQWYIAEENGVSFAFKYDDENGIVPCNSEAAVFHCYLPTMDKTGFPFKVNADFSTDPSRKHIIPDEITENALGKLGVLYVQLVKRFTEKKDEKKISVLALLNVHLSLSDMVSRLESRIDACLRKEAWVLRSDGEITTPVNIAYYPRWLEKEDKERLFDNMSGLRMILLDNKLYASIDKAEQMVAKYGAKELPSEILAGLLTNADSIKWLNPKLAAKVFVYCFRGFFSHKEKMSSLFLPTVNGGVQIQEITSSDDLESEFYTTVLTLVNSKEKTTLGDNFACFSNANKSKPVNRKTQTPIKMPTITKQMAVNRWKTPIQNCLAVESLDGRSGKDVSRKCDEYNIESVDASGIRRYIVVKQVKTLGDSFTLSEKEYSAAQRLGNAYYVFVIATESDDVAYTFIGNPIETLKLDKVVKEWEFVCNAYNVLKKENKQNDDILDQRLLKSILPEYFNSQQRAFILDFVASGELELTSTVSTNIEKINSIIDFYTGESFFMIKDQKVTAEVSKINAIRKILTF